LGRCDLQGAGIASEGLALEKKVASGVLRCRRGRTSKLGVGETEGGERSREGGRLKVEGEERGGEVARIWKGTEGEGLVEFSRTTRESYWEETE